MPEAWLRSLVTPAKGGPAEILARFNPSGSFEKLRVRGVNFLNEDFFQIQGRSTARLLGFYAWIVSASSERNMDMQSK